jgi:demethylmenaquinone methyltransferase/2-methoxy-6-polyprenyl-1,4-benzoquinol methylase
MSRAGLDKAPADVARMFDAVAQRYDVTNDVLSFGLARRWRHAVRATLDVRGGQRVLDLAAGTATSSVAFTVGVGDVQVVAADFSLGMLREGRRRLGGASVAGVSLVAADGLRLPFADASFDRVTISFGLRNTADPVLCLRELRRVTAPGGRLVVCEFSSPTWKPFRTVYLNYLMRLLPRVARAVSSDPEAYVYLAESIRAWPDQRGLADLVASAGWSGVSWRNLTGGIVALHTGTAGG